MNDQIAMNELELYAFNTYKLDAQRNSIISNVERRIQNGTYDASKAPKLWMYWIDNAAREYCREFGGEVRIMFPKALRLELAEKTAANQYEESLHNLSVTSEQITEALK